MILMLLINFENNRGISERYAQSLSTIHLRIRKFYCIHNLWLISIRLKK